jgi:hypothetical protein
MDADDDDEDEEEAKNETAKDLSILEQDRSFLRDAIDQQQQPLLLP